MLADCPKAKAGLNARQRPATKIFDGDNGLILITHKD
jgi:hypothetical protein